MTYISDDRDLQVSNDCPVHEFVIGRAIALVEDFGEYYDNYPGDMCCGDYKFKPHKYVDPAVIKKYSIDTVDVEIIKRFLADNLFTGSCGLCQ